MTKSQGDDIFQRVDRARKFNIPDGEKSAFRRSVIGAAWSESKWPWVLVCLVILCFSNLHSIAVQQYSVISIDVPDAYPAAINNQGKVVGAKVGSDGELHGFAWSIDAQGNQLTTDLLDGAPDLFWRSSANAINNGGQICGKASTGSINYESLHAVVWSEPYGYAAPITPSCDFTWAQSDGSVAKAINDSGEIIGSRGCWRQATYGACQDRGAFLYSGGVTKTIGAWVSKTCTNIDGSLSTNLFSTAVAINAGGVIVGYGDTQNAAGDSGPWHAFRVRREALDVLEDMGNLGGWRIYPHAINTAGTVVGEGTSDPSGNYYRAFRTLANRSISAATDMIPTLGGDENGAYAINNSDQVVGSSSLSDGTGHAFIFENGTVTDLNDLISPNSGWELQNAYGINDDGWIFGDGYLNGVYKWFLLRPVVEGIDVSHFQNENTNPNSINWGSVKSAGKSFVFVKASEGDYIPDGGVGHDYTMPNLQGAAAANLLAIPYHIAKLDDPSDAGAIAEADYFLSRIGNYVGNGHLPPALDLESMYNRTGSQLSQWVRAWSQRVQKQKPGVTPILYMYRCVLVNLETDLQLYPLWIADYDAHDAIATPCYTGPCWPQAICWPDWKFKQYSDVGTCPGINGSVDLDSFQGNLTTLVALTTHTARPRFTGIGGGAIQPPANGQFQLQVSAPGWQEVTIQSSDDLATWTDVATVTITSGLGIFTDTNAGTRTQGFYRAKP